MKKVTLLAASLCAALVSFGQWSDDFESYTVGDYVGVAGASAGWTTWSGSPGTAEDVQVSDANSQSGDNSLYFEGDAGQDVVLDFGGVKNSGIFHMDISVNADSGYYFNLQAGENIGDAWALDFQSTDSVLWVYNYDGSAFIFHSETDIQGDAGTWHTFSIDVNLDLAVDNWTVSYDGVELTTFTNPVASSISMLNIYPYGPGVDFYVDDVSWSHTPSQMVTFKVDMNYYTAGTFTTPEVNGTYNGWCGACNVLEDGDGDGIWEGTFMVTADSIEYKFAYDNWTGQETLTEGLSCTKTTGEFTNRFLMLDGSDVELDVVCWEQCTECIEPAGVSSLKGAAGVSVYPNPATDYLTIEFGEEASEMNISIVDVMGRTVMPTINQFSGTRTEISVNELPQGAYFITGTSEGYNFKKSIMITK